MHASSRHVLKKRTPKITRCSSPPLPIPIAPQQQKKQKNSNNQTTYLTGTLASAVQRHLGNLSPAALAAFLRTYGSLAGSRNTDRWGGEELVLETVLAAAEKSWNDAGVLRDGVVQEVLVVVRCRAREGGLLHGECR